MNGYSGFRPPFFETLLDAVNRLPASQALVTLHDLGVRSSSATALWRPIQTAATCSSSARAPAPSASRIVWSPATDAKFASATGVVPPDPGPPPFVTGESATYRVHWTSGPMRVPAATVTIAVQPPQGSERYRFQVTAKTEPWMSRFYEADVLIETTASDGLLPYSYREAIEDREANRASDGVRRQSTRNALDERRHVDDAAARRRRA